MASFSKGTSFTDGVTGDVTAAKLHALVDNATPVGGLVTDRTAKTSVVGADLVLISDSADSNNLKKVTVTNLAGNLPTAKITTGTIDTATLGTTTGTLATLTNASITAGTIATATLGTTTGTAASFTSGTLTTGLIPTGTFGTTTSTAATITTGTIPTLTIGSTTATAGTITNLTATLAGDFTISQGTGTLGTTGVTAGTYGGSSAIPTITVDSKGRVTTASTSSITTGYTGFRNRIINGDMRIDQRNAGASLTPTNGQYLVDRFGATLTQASKYTAQQNAGSITPPTGFTNYLGLTSSSSYSVLTGDTFGIYQYIEGFNTSDLAWGTASASAITLSFWVRSSLTGTFGGALTNNAQNRSYPFSYTISSANTWTKATITITGDTSGTWTTDNSVGIGLRFGLGSGSTYSGTSGAWAAGNFIQPTSTVSVVGTSGATFYITGVQLEAGSTATEFERRPYGTELALCQRYFIRYTNRAMGTMNGASHLYNGSIAFPVTMRSAPTLVAGASFSVNTGSAGTPALDPTSTNNSAITTADQAIFWNSSSNWTSNNFASITCSLTSEL